MRSLVISDFACGAGSAPPFRCAAAVLTMLLALFVAFCAGAQTPPDGNGATAKPDAGMPDAGVLTKPVESTPDASKTPGVVDPFDIATPPGAATPPNGESTGVEVRHLQILSIRSDDAFEQADALTAALKLVVQRAPGWQVPPGDFSLEVLVAALDCTDPPNAGCLAEIANRTKSGHFVYGSLYRIGKGVRADLHVWHAGEQTPLQFDYSDNLVEPADDALFNLARLALANLLGLDAGTVAVEVDKDPTTLRWNGRPVGVITGGKGSLVLPTGEHELVAEAVGHRDEKLTVTVVEGETTNVSVLFVPPPPVEEPAPVVVAEEASGGVSTRTALGYTSVGLGAALIAGGVFAAVDVQGKSDDADLASYRAALAPSQDACVEARAGKVLPGAPAPAGVAELCDSADTLTALQYVFFGLGAAAVGTGAYFLISADDSEESGSGRPQLRARVGHDSAKLDLTLAF